MSVYLVMSDDVSLHFVRFIYRPVISGFGLYDPTSIMNASELNRAQKEGWVKLAFYILLFFYYIYGSVTVVFLPLAYCV